MPGNKKGVKYGYGSTPGKDIQGSQGNSTRVPYGKSATVGTDTSAPAHYMPRKTKTSDFKAKMAPRRKK